MEALTYLDTHVVVWLYEDAAGSPLSRGAREAVRRADELRISPAVTLELKYLYELERISLPPALITEELGGTLGLRTCDAPFAAVVLAAETEDWTRDPFDRLIVAQAALLDAPLVTKDRTIRDHYEHSIW